MDILTFIEKSNKAIDSEELFSLLESMMENYGFDRVIFSLMTEHVAQEQSADHGLMHNYPKEWMNHYIDSAYQDIDPVRKYVLQAPSPFLWKNLRNKITFSKEQEKCMLEAKDIGLNSGVAFPMRGPLGGIAGIGAASSFQKANISQDSLSLLNAACQQFYMAYIALEKKHDYKSKNVTLTYREAEILKWCAQGKTTWEIGVILNLSEAGVLFHTRNVMKKFSTSSRVYAVMQAVRLGLIDL